MMYSVCSWQKQFSIGLGAIGHIEAWGLASATSRGELGPPVRSALAISDGQIATHYYNSVDILAAHRRFSALLKQRSFKNELLEIIHVANSFVGHIRASPGGLSEDHKAYFATLIRILRLYNFTTDDFFRSCDWTQDELEDLVNLVDPNGWGISIPVLTDMTRLASVRDEELSNKQMEDLLYSNSGQLFGLRQDVRPLLETFDLSILRKTLGRLTPIKDHALATRGDLSELLHRIGLLRLAIRGVFTGFVTSCVPILKQRLAEYFEGIKDASTLWSTLRIGELTEIENLQPIQTYVDRYRSPLAMAWTDEHSTLLGSHGEAILRKLMARSSEPELDSHGKVENGSNITTTQGITVSGSGTVYGTVLVIPSEEMRIEDAGDLLRRMPSDAVLVTTMTYPSVMPYLGQIRAIVTERGGRTCHAAVIAREFGIPCVVGAFSATHVLKTGDSVRIDLNSGRIFVDDLAKKNH
ncbi:MULTISPECIES: PEP-utilizing enzyme [Rhizobium/Agrobacterium group]|nr:MULTISPECIES: PEP-utilizing enzyme [Agrobacterium tumefaciens complex]AAS02144.1 probable phosphoenolpyruvate synthase [Agrobacterium radiobacter]